MEGSYIKRDVFIVFDDHQKKVTITVGKFIAEYSRSAEQSHIERSIPHYPINMAECERKIFAFSSLFTAMG